MIDFSLLHHGELSLAELSAGLDVEDLHRLTDEMLDRMLALVEGATDADVVFVPQDQQAYDEFASDPGELNLAWTLGHVIVHTTASAEEAAARASQLARGVPVEGRNRYEVPWRTLTGMAQLRQRLQESRRMRHAFLDAWPAEPHFELLYTPRNPKFKPFNAVGMFLNGLSHDDAHLGQIADIVAQARAVRSTGQAG